LYIEVSPSQPASAVSKLPGMVLIPAGPFRMGSEQGAEFETPIHEVFLDDFWIDQAPVTNQQFARFTADTRYVTDAERAGQAWGYRNGSFSMIRGLNWSTYSTADRALHPVLLVSWHDAAAYCAWAGKRLPTEAEWEKAALGGCNHRLYPWGDEIPNGDQSNFARSPAALPPTTPVMQFPPNAYGLYDMVGNVWQWCADWYGENAYAAASTRNPTGPENGSTRIRRGGSWNVIQPFRLRCANRGAALPSGAAPNIGFRCVADSGGRA
jgi:formylglycine-generating enzyme